MNFSPTPARAVFVMGLLALAVWAFVFIGKLPSITDVFLHTLPSRNANLTAFAQGSLPLWDPAIGCGTPQLASGLGACFYPPYLLWNMTGLSHWLVYLSFLHLIFAFLGFYLWARSQGIAPPWASLGALSFAGSLHMTRLWGYPVFLATQAWTPWLFFLASKFLKEGRSRWIIGLTLAASLQILAGYPHFTFYSFLFLALWTLFRPVGWDLKGKAGLAMGFALGLTSLHWLPLLDYLSYATRGTWGGPETFPYFFRWGDLAALFSPSALGAPEMEGYRGQGANANFMLYFGLVPLAAWGIGTFFRKGQGPATFMLWAAWGWLVWMLGWNFFPLRVVPETVLFSLEPTKALGVFLLAACTGAGHVLTGLFREGWSERKRSAFTWLIACLWALDLFLLAPRTVHPVGDPFRRTEHRVLAQSLQEGLRGARLLSLRAKEQLIFRQGEKGASLHQTAADGWVRGFLANSQQVWGIRSAQAYLSLWLPPMETLWASFNQLETYEGMLPDVAGIRLLLFPVELKGSRYRTVVKGEDQYLIENSACLPDAWAGREALALPDLGAVLQTMKGRDPAGKGRVLLTEGQVLTPPRRTFPFPSGSQGWIRAMPCRASFQGDLKGKGWFFWNETYAPGWRAWVDGRPAPIHRAFGFFMAVPLPVEVRAVEFRYEPTAFRLGCFLSLVFLIFGPAWIGRKMSWWKEGTEG